MPKGKGKATVKAVMHDFKAGDLHSGSKHGRVVTDRKQAIAIAMSEAKPLMYEPANEPKIADPYDHLT